jgi:iron complex transport system substrate-binding protein
MGGNPMRPRLLLAAALLAMSAGASSAAAPRIVSMNICTDQMLLALADPAQILGLSRFSRDPRQGLVEGARHFPVLSGGAEDILVLKPDVVTASQFDKRSTRELLKANGVNLIELPVPRNLGDVREQIREMGNIAGHPERAAAEVARLDAAIAEARKLAGVRHFRVLPLSRRGWVPGRDSLSAPFWRRRGLPMRRANSASISAALPRWKRSCS